VGLGPGWGATDSSTYFKLDYGQNFGEDNNADKGYSSAKNRAFIASFGVKHRIARKGIESTERLGRYRWVVERTIAWFHRFKRLRTRYERNPESHIAFMILAAGLICWRQLTGRGL